MKNEGFPAIEYNRLAREKHKKKLLEDILFDMQVSRLEGWDVMQYLYELRDLLDSIINKEGR